MTMEKITKPFIQLFCSFQDLSLLTIRFTLAYGFYGPAMNKLQNFSNIVTWFENTLHLPYPFANAVLATATEILGVILLTLGLKTRFIAIPLMVIMVVAINSVHWINGFACAQNGYEVPFYYFIMLFALMAFGAGKYSLDETLFKKWFSSK